MTVLDQLREIRLLPVVTIDDARHADALAEALVAGGLPGVEIAFRTPEASAALERIAGRGDVLTGAGTLLTVDDVDRAVGAGAAFAVTPGWDDAVVDRAQERGMPLIPGIATPTELQRALARGISDVKVFPVAPLGGTDYLAALTGPYPKARFLPSGGIRADDVNQYLSLSCVPAVGASWMVPRNLVAAGDEDALTRLITNAVKQLT